MCGTAKHNCCEVSAVRRAGVQVLSHRNTEWHLRERGQERESHILQIQEGQSSSWCYDQAIVTQLLKENAR